jgi:hypothetical protein
MATCPRCGGFLDDHHRCVGLWKYRLRAWRVLLLGGIVGGVAGWLIFSAVAGQAFWLAVVIAAVIGILIVSALPRW